MKPQMPSQGPYPMTSSKPNFPNTPPNLEIKFQHEFWRGQIPRPYHPVTVLRAWSSHDPGSVTVQLSVVPSELEPGKEARGSMKQLNSDTC
jgi:hypothetical protein